MANPSVSDERDAILRYTQELRVRAVKAHKNSTMVVIDQMAAWVEARSDEPTLSLFDQMLKWIDDHLAHHEKKES